MRKDILNKRLQRLQDKKTTLKSRAMASEDVNEVRSIQEEITDLDAEITETQEELDAIEQEERTMPTPDAQKVNADISGAFKAEKREQNTESLEYREAFRKYVTKGIVSAELRNGDVISTADTGAAIPMTIMNEVINTVRKRYGNLYNKVRKTSVPGGVKIPVGSLQATFRWISESTVSPRQKVGALGAITFAYNEAELRIATTWLANLLTLSSFEAELTNIIAIAYLQMMDEAIVKGSGDGAPLGILNDTRVTGQSGHTITMTAAKMSNWKNWRTDFFAKLPLGYRGGEFIFAASTVETYLQTMSDDNNNPVFYQATGLEVNDGDAQNPNGRFFGRNISLVEPDILPDFDTANANDIVGIYWQPEEYMVNENFGFTMLRYFDQETNEWVDKALTVVDGKVLNPAGIYLIAKGT